MLPRRGPHRHLRNAGPPQNNRSGGIGASLVSPPLPWAPQTAFPSTSDWSRTSAAIPESSGSQQCRRWHARSPAAYSLRVDAAPPWPRRSVGSGVPALVKPNNGKRPPAGSPYLCARESPNTLLLPPRSTARSNVIPHHPPGRIGALHCRYGCFAPSLAALHGATWRHSGVGDAPRRSVDSQAVCRRRSCVPSTTLLRLSKRLTAPYRSGPSRDWLKVSRQAPAFSAPDGLGPLA
jgi:hypothetical protein